MISAKEKRFLKYWDDQKTGGKWQYILIYSLGWSIIIFILPLAFSFVYDMYTGDKIFQLPLWATIVLSVVLAVAVSFFSWHRNQKKYNKILKKEQA